MRLMNDATRRQGMRAGTTGAAAPAAPLPAFGQGSGNSGGKTDPRSKHPKPPFKPQSQPWPGLASQMDPRPDHGETSYVGSGRLLGRRAVVTGGESRMGRAAALA